MFTGEFIYGLAAKRRIQPRALCVGVRRYRMVASWSPETQEQILAEWEDWQEANTNKPEHIIVVIVVRYLVVQTVR